MATEVIIWLERMVLNQCCRKCFHENSKSKLSHSFILFKSSILVKWIESYDLAVSGLIQLIGKQAATCKW